MLMTNCGLVVESIVKQSLISSLVVPAVDHLYSKVMVEDLHTVLIFFNDKDFCLQCSDSYFNRIPYCYKKNYQDRVITR